MAVLKLSIISSWSSSPGVVCPVIMEMHMFRYLRIPYFSGTFNLVVDFIYKFTERSIYV